MNKNLSMMCSFCGKEQSDSTRFIASPNGDAFICDECINICNDILKTDRIDVPKQKILSPKEIKKHLDNYIIGQDNAKVVLSVAVYNHYKKIAYNKKAKNSDKNIELDKSNVLLIGPTGSGKTLLAKTLAKILNVPFASADATTLTEAGYVGEDVESVLSKLLVESGGDVKKAETGIIYIDEIDKIAKKSENKALPKDPSGEGVQQGLLKIIEGTIANVPLQSSRKMPYQETVAINTSNILFICGGAFVGLESIVSQRNNKLSLGFNKEENKKFVDEKIYPQDLVKFGLIPEFVGRLPIISQLNKLSETDMVKILTQPKNALIKQYEEMFKIDGIELVVENSALNKIAQDAIGLESGARGLRTVMENTMLNAMFNYPKTNTNKIILETGLNGEVIAKTIVNQSSNLATK